MFTPRPTLHCDTTNTEFSAVLARRRLAVEQSCSLNCRLQHRVFCNDEANAEECRKEQFLHLHRALSARGPEARTVAPSRRADNLCQHGALEGRRHLEGEIASVAFNLDTCMKPARFHRPRTCINCRTDNAEQSKDMITAKTRFTEQRTRILLESTTKAQLSCVRTSIFANSGTLARVVLFPHGCLRIDRKLNLRIFPPPSVLSRWVLLLLPHGPVGLQSKCRICNVLINPLEHDDVVHVVDG